MNENFFPFFSCNKFTLCCSDLNGGESKENGYEICLIEISVFIVMLNASEFKYCSFLIETLISTFYDGFHSVLHRPVSLKQFHRKTKVAIKIQFGLKYRSEKRTAVLK